MNDTVIQLFICVCLSSFSCLFVMTTRLLCNSMLPVLSFLCVYVLYIVMRIRKRKFFPKTFVEWPKPIFL